MSSALRVLQEAHGGRFATLAGEEVARHYGDGGAEYVAVRQAAGVAIRSDLVPIRMWGRDPVKMLHGLVTNDVTAISSDRGLYATMLTPKGRVIGEMRVFQRSADPAELLLLAPREALEGSAEHLRKFVPPMFARWEDSSDSIGIVGVYGPLAEQLLRELLDGQPPAPEEEAAGVMRFGEAEVLAAFTRDAGGEPGYDLVVPAAQLPELWEAMLAAAQPHGGGPVGLGALETLRIEAGRPRYGWELSEEVIPTEAFEAIGWMPRAISFSKGCYTGQEVIVRIAHRGHVNRHLRGLLLGDSPTPSPRTPLFNVGTGKQIGWTTSAAVSPRLGQTISLAFVRREAGHGDEVRIGSPDGPVASVVALPFGETAG